MRWRAARAAWSVRGGRATAGLDEAAFRCVCGSAHQRGVSTAWACDCGFAERRDLVDDDGEKNGAHYWPYDSEYTTQTHTDPVDGQAKQTKTAGYRRRTVRSEAGDDLQACRV
ncbi:hypothetical protein ACOZ38_29090 [Sphaerisporangium viridialbum]|uniref:hypothetical protein n=1 Tax=Sphaerisporangium viridialbum TaxID=46189 RepID=UPI003C72C1FC